MKKNVLVAACVCMGVFLEGSIAGQMQYTVIDLGTLGGDESNAVGINEAGQVVGHALTSADIGYAFLWQEGEMTSLGTLGGVHSCAHAINEYGQVAGDSPLSGEHPRHGFLWVDGQMTDLGTLGGSVSQAYGINDAAQVVGESWFHPTESIPHAFLWEGGHMTDLGTLGGDFSIAKAINNLGQVVGHAETEFFGHAFLWENRQMVDLQGFDESEWSCAYAINDAGQVVGEAEIPGPGSYHHAFLWDNGEILDLGTLGGYISRADGINELGQVVGGSSTMGGMGWHAFLWDNGIMYDLNDLVVGETDMVLVAAHAINDAGWIVGQGTIAGETHGFLLVPEPATLVLLAVGGFVMVRRRRKDRRE